MKIPDYPERYDRDIASKHRPKRMPQRPSSKVWTIGPTGERVDISPRAVEQRWQEVHRLHGAKPVTGGVGRETEKLMKLSFNGLMNRLSELGTALNKKAHSRSFSEIFEKLSLIAKVAEARAKQLGNKVQLIMKRCREISEQFIPAQAETTS